MTAPASARAEEPRENAVLAHGFISDAERRELLAWARAMRPHLRENGEYRFFRKVEQLPRVDPLYTQVRKRVQACLGVAADAEPEPRFGWYLSIIHAGGYVHAHTDFAPEGTRHLRANLVLQTPYHGGRPVVGRSVHHVSPGTLLAFFPSEHRHFSEPSYGRRRRIILSFGYLVPASYALPAELTGPA